MTTSREIALDLLRHLLSGERDDINSTGSTPNSYLYRGEQFDLDLGLYYLRARYYNPALDGS